MDVIALELETALIARKSVATSSCHEVPRLGAIRPLEAEVLAAAAAAAAVVAVIDVAMDMVPKWQCPGRRRFLDLVFEAYVSKKSV